MHNNLSKQDVFVNVSDRDNLLNRSDMPVLIKHGWIKHLFTLAIVTLLSITAISLIWTQYEINIIARSSVICIIAIFCSIYIYHLLSQGRFILSANEKGFIFRSKMTKTQYVFVSWDNVDNIRYIHLDGIYSKPVGNKKFYSTSDDGGAIEIYTNISSDTKSPVEPSNGYVCRENDRYVFSFSPGLGKYGTSQISKLVELHENYGQ